MFIEGTERGFGRRIFLRSKISYSYSRYFGIRCSSQPSCQSFVDSNQSPANLKPESPEWMFLIILFPICISKSFGSKLSIEFYVRADVQACVKNKIFNF
jgi:hypothetical protein